MGDDVALLEEHARGDLTPAGNPSQEELEVHREVLELLALGVVHDRPRVGVGLDRKALLVPADRLALLFERGAEAGEGPRLGRQLLRRLVVLVESHLGLLGRVGAAGVGRRTARLVAVGYPVDSGSGSHGSQGWANSSTFLRIAEKPSASAWAQNSEVGSSYS